MKRPPADLLQRSADEGSRLLALTYLDQACEAERRMAAGADPEALHDFRVALRRLRSCLRAYREQLGKSVPKKLRRELRDLTSSTNPLRDAEVQLAWLHRQSESLQPGEAEGLAWLIGRLQGRLFEARTGQGADLAPRFVQLSGRLRRRLASFRVVVQTGGPVHRPTMGQVTGALIREHAAALGAAIGSVQGAADTLNAHAARIQGKRLRYLLEPFTARVTRIRGAVLLLKQLQDVLGHLHDMQVLDQEIAGSLAAFPEQLSSMAGPVPGLRAVQQIVQHQANASFDEFQATWSPVRSSRFQARVEELGTVLETSDWPKQPPVRGTPHTDADPDPSTLPRELGADNSGLEIRHGA